jgi:uncharacterized lipoprotein NlpE involved in copper resistance
MKTGVCVAMVGAVVLAGCASQTEQDAAMATATRFLDAVARSDTAAACELLTAQTRDELVTADGQSCARALPADRLGGTVESADSWSDQALVKTDRGALFLTEFDSGWLVSAAGCVADGDAPYRCVVGG